jgi:hypothetical protein
MKTMVVPFILQHHEEWRQAAGRAALPYLRIEGYDDDRAVPLGNSGPVLELLTSGELVATTCENVRILFDDENEGTRRQPPYDYDAPDELSALALRGLQEWVDETVFRLFQARDPAALFDSLYQDFESRYFDEKYSWLWFSTLVKFAFEGHEINLEDGLTIRYLAPLESKELIARWQHVREKSVNPNVVLVQELTLQKGSRWNFEGKVLPNQAREKILFCIRALRPGGAYSDELVGAKRTCWGLDFPASTFFRRASTSEDRGNTFLDRGAIDNLRTLWAAIRARDDFNLRFLATKVNDVYQRTSLLDRFVDAAIVLQNIFGSDGHRFALAMAWALRGHRDAGVRREIYDLGREVNRRRNAILHGNSRLVEPLIADLGAFGEFTGRAEECMREALQLFLLNEGFHEHVDDLLLGVPVTYHRLPFTF